MNIVWHRRSLRLRDQLALALAEEGGQKVLSLVIEEPKEHWGRARLWWLKESVKGLKRAYEQRGIRLLERRGEARAIFTDLFEKHRVKGVYWQGSGRGEEDEALVKWMKERGVEGVVVEGDELLDYREMVSGSGNPYVVFAPFAKAAYDRIGPVKCMGPRVASVKGSQVWCPGEAGGQGRLHGFCRKGLEEYGWLRDRVDLEGTSRLSPHLALGEVSIRDVWSRCVGHKGAEPFLRQLLFREFARSFLFHFPHAAKVSWRQEFEAYPWREDPEGVRLWQQGLTGYPMIDAGMRQLLEMGWMHNRARMIVASFLVKDLMVDWRVGAEWFWDHLVDADVANNTLGWQWVAGCGPDAAPFFRVFNPVLQGKKFDPEGDYVRKYVPELKKLPVRWVHAPWEAPESVLKEAGVKLGKTYPAPMVDHATARIRALEGFEKVKMRTRRT